MTPPAIPAGAAFSRVSPRRGRAGGSGNLAAWIAAADWPNGCLPSGRNAGGDTTSSTWREQNHQVLQVILVISRNSLQTIDYRTLPNVSDHSGDDRAGGKPISRAQNRVAWPRGRRKPAGESAAAPVSDEAEAPPANPRPVSESARGRADSHVAVLETIFGRAFDHRQIQPRT
jgi:hypothetical protein